MKLIFVVVDQATNFALQTEPSLKGPKKCHSMNGLAWEDLYTQFSAVTVTQEVHRHMLSCCKQITMTAI
jgi:hypothetical protein